MTKKLLHEPNIACNFAPENEEEARADGRDARQKPQSVTTQTQDLQAMKKIQYSIAMQANPQKPDEAKKAYGKLQLTGIVNIDEIAEHITEHNSVFSKGTIVGCITEMVACIREFLLQGYKIDLGYLGTFTPSISCTGAKTKDEFTPSNIKDLNVNFQIGDGLENLRRDAQFERTISRKAQAAAQKAENEGKTAADWTPEPTEAEGGTTEP